MLFRKALQIEIVVQGAEPWRRQFDLTHAAESVTLERIRIADITQRIHLPIQFGPWSYTYSRGS